MIVRWPRLILHEGCILLHKFFFRRVTLWPDNTVIKAGKHIRLQEVDALRVAAEAKLPVPRVYDFGTRPDGLNFIKMDYIDGKSLDNVWPTMDDDERKSITRQLRALVDQMRSVEAPPQTIGGCDGKEMRDTRSHMTYYAPSCTDEAAFNEYLLGAMDKRNPKVISDALAARLRADHRTVLTHSDLAPRNIMVKDGKIVALIDWEEAGWYPEYWEFVNFFQRSIGSEGREDYAEDIFSQGYPTELLDYLVLSQFHKMC